MGPTGPVTSFELWTHWIPPDLHGFYKWAMDTSALLNKFILKIMHHRQTARLQAWSQPGFGKILPPIRISGFALSLSLRLLIWFASPKIRPMGLGFWSSQLLLMPTFERHGCLIFVGMGTLLSPSSLS